GSGAEDEIVPGSARHVQILEAMAEGKASELETATKRLKDGRAAAGRATADAAAATRSLRAAESNAAPAETAVKTTEKEVETATSPEAKERAEGARTKAAAKADELKAKLDSVKAQEKAKREAADRAGEEVKSALAAKELAAQAAQNASR